MIISVQRSILVAALCTPMAKRPPSDESRALKRADEGHRGFAEASNLPRGYNDQDVLFMPHQTSPINDYHPGNIHLRAMIQAYRDEYMCANTKGEKRRVVGNIIYRVRGSNGRFFMFDKDARQWFEVDDIVANTKIGELILRKKRTLPRTMVTAGSGSCTESLNVAFGATSLSSTSLLQRDCSQQGHEERLHSGLHHLGPREWSPQFLELYNRQQLFLNEALERSKAEGSLKSSRRRRKQDMGHEDTKFGWKGRKRSRSDEDCVVEEKKSRKDQPK